MRHPYFFAPGEPRRASVPFISVVYKHNLKSTTPTLALVDSGAMVSFAPLDLAIWLGIKVDNKKGLKIRGFNNAVTMCFPAQVTVVIDSNNFEIPVYFGGNSGMQFILGQDPLFDKIKVTFERYDDSFSVEKINVHSKKN